MVAALKLGICDIKDEAISTILEFVAENFVRLCAPKAFDALDTESMELVLKCNCLLIRSELDVLRAYISWLDGKKNTPSQSNDSASRTELAKHIRIDRIGPDDLREAMLLAQKSKLTVKVAQCLNAFVNFVFR